MWLDARALVLANPLGRCISHLSFSAYPLLKESHSILHSAIHLAFLGEALPCQLFYSVVAHVRMLPKASESVKRERVSQVLTLHLILPYLRTTLNSGLQFPACCA